MSTEGTPPRVSEIAIVTWSDRDNPPAGFVKNPPPTDFGIGASVYNKTTGILLHFGMTAICLDGKWETIAPWRQGSEVLLTVIRELLDARQRIAALESENAALREALEDCDNAAGTGGDLRRCAACGKTWNSASMSPVVRHRSECKVPAALARTAAAGKARDERLIQQGRDAERARTTQDDKERAFAWVTDSKRFETEATDRGEAQSLAAEFAAVRQQGREEGARIALVAAASECDEIAEHNGDAEECSTAIRTLRNPALPLTPEQPSATEAPKP